MKRVMMILAVAALMAAGAVPAVAKTAGAAATDGANYLVAEQLDDGGWSWENGGTSASNITGATGIGLVYYYNRAGGSGYLAAAKDAGDYIGYPVYPTGGETRFATFDPYYGWELSKAAGDSTWSDRIKAEFFDTLDAGTYGDGNYDTAGWIAAVETGRTGTWVNLRPWEFSTIAVTAANIGNAGQEGLFKQAILDGLNTLDNSDPDNVYCDLIGVAGGARGLALDGVTSFAAISSPNHAGIDTISTLAGLADYLVGEQNGDGSWYWHSDLALPGEGDKDTQTTAYAVLALEAAGAALGTSVYNDEIAVGRSWLVTMQDSATGGFRGYPGDVGLINNEVSGEATAALAGAIPEPAGLGLIGLALLAVRKKRN